MAYTTAQVNAWYQAVQFQNGPTATVNSWVSALNAGTATPASVQNSIITTDSYTLTVVNPVLRLYQASFNSVPDQNGQAFWVGQYGSGAQTYQQIANGFANSAQFKAAYGNTDANTLANSAQVTTMYQNILLRNPDAGGLAFWTGKAIGAVLAGISTSPEMVTNMSVPITNYQAAEIAGNEATSGSMYQYPGFPGASYPLTVNPDNIVASGDFATINGAVTDQGLQTFQSWDSINGGTNGGAAIGGATLSVAMNGVAVNPTLSNLASLVVQDAATGGIVNTIGLGGLSTLRNITLNGNGAASGFTLNSIGSVPAGQVTISGTGV